MTVSKRLFDLTLAAVLAALLLPLFLALVLAVWGYDRRNPFYVGRRVGAGGEEFGMIKFRSMIVDADKSGVMSTAGDDTRITPVGKLLRKFKLDEIAQLINILKGDMSFVGPRPNVPTEVALYSDEEMRLVSVPPGVTDLASIVFADESDILEGSSDPDRDYNLLIRPWKSRLGLHYLEVRSMLIDAQIILLTALSVVSRKLALAGVASVLQATGADPDLINIAKRGAELQPRMPPGVTEDTWKEHVGGG